MLILTTNLTHITLSETYCTSRAILLILHIYYNMNNKANSRYASRRSERKKSAKRSVTRTILGAIAVAAVIFVAWRINAAERSAAPVIDVPAAELLAVALPSATAEQIVEYTGFTISYNADAHQPNYAAWELNEEKLKSNTSRRDVKFDVDRNVAGTAELYDYRRSGFDRGHMMPAADAKWDDRAMTESHLLTNICPQDHNMNGGVWATLEGNCRQWAARDSSIIIICGPVLTDSMTRTIGENGKIPVPERFFKVVLAPYDRPPRGIGFLMNNGPVDGGVQAAAVSIDQVEAATGYDFFAVLPDEIENEVEAQCAYHDWQRKRR